MGNVLRVLGIVLASMLLGLVALFLLLFTICGGLESSDGAGILAICLVLLAGCVALIVFLGRGLSAARTAARGLAVPPSDPGGPPSDLAGPPLLEPVVTAPAIKLPKLTGTDLQVLVGLRALLAISVLLSLGSMLFTVVSLNSLGSALVTQLALRSILGVLPPAALLVAVSVRNPPAPVALDATAGLGIASILFRFGYLAFAGVFMTALNQANFLSAMLPRLVGYSALEAAIVGLALYLRSRVAPMNATPLVLATLIFLVYEGLVQALMTAMMGLLY